MEETAPRWYFCNPNLPNCYRIVNDRPVFYVYEVEPNTISDDEGVMSAYVSPAKQHLVGLVKTEEQWKRYVQDQARFTDGLWMGLHVSYLDGAHQTYILLG